jgi:hypothetical protein
VVDQPAKHHVAVLNSSGKWVLGCQPVVNVDDYGIDADVQTVEPLVELKVPAAHGVAEMLPFPAS